VGKALEAVFYLHKRRYDAPRVRLALNAASVDCSKNYVAKLMRARCLQVYNGKDFRYIKPIGATT